MGQKGDDKLVGSTLAGRYEILAVLGQGGMSVIYKGHHNLMQRDVAIKMLHSKYLDDADSTARFQQEAQAASRLNNLNVITVHDFGVTDNGQHFLVMDFVEGNSLGEILDEEGILLPKRAVPIFLQVCVGLGHAHENGIIHRDLKPGNIMIITREGRDLVKVVDFGVAKMLPRAGKPMQQLTHTGEIFGTSLYLSPEQCAGKTLDARSDVYAFGCVMYETLTGMPPFVGINLLDTMQKHINEPAPPFSATAPDLPIPAFLEKIVLKCLEKLPGDRYQSMTEIAQDLEIVQTHLNAPDKANATTTDDGLIEDKPADDHNRTIADEHLPRPEKKDFRWAAAVLALGLAIAGLCYVFVPRTKTPIAEPVPVSKPPVVADAKVNDFVWKKLNDEGQSAFDNGEWELAEKKWLAASGEAKKFGRTDKHYLMSLRKVADVYYVQGRDQDGEKIDAEIAELRKERQASAAEEKKRRDDRIATLAFECHEQGQCDRAEVLLKRSLTIAEKAFGEQSPQTAERLNDLAVFYLSMGDYEKAEPLLKRAMTTKGPSDTITTVKHKTAETYAKLLRETNRSAEAKKLESQN